MWRQDFSHQCKAEKNKTVTALCRVTETVLCDNIKLCKSDFVIFGSLSLEPYLYFLIKSKPKISVNTICSTMCILYIWSDHMNWTSKQLDQTDSLQREQIWSVMTLCEFNTVTIDDQSVNDRSSIVTVLNSRNLRCVIRILFSL